MKKYNEDVLERIFAALQSMKGLADSDMEFAPKDIAGTYSVTRALMTYAIKANLFMRVGKNKYTCKGEINREDAKLVIDIIRDYSKTHSKTHRKSKPTETPKLTKLSNGTWIVTGDDQIPRDGIQVCMKEEGITYKEANIKLAKKYGLSAPASLEEGEGKTDRVRKCKLRKDHFRSNEISINVLDDDMPISEISELIKKLSPKLIKRIFEHSNMYLWLELLIYAFIEQGEDVFIYFTDEQLKGVLSERGYSGTLTKTI